MSNYFYTFDNHVALQSETNKYVYFKQDFVPKELENPGISSKVLVNPHFNKKVFVNPNYIPNSSFAVKSSGKIHVNPNLTIGLPLPPTPDNVSKIHINPKILGNPNSQNELNNRQRNLLGTNQNVVYSSKTKLIRTPVKKDTVQESKRIRRTSLTSKFKVIRSSFINKNPETKLTNKLLLNSRYKLKRDSTNKLVKNDSPGKFRTRFKLDNRRKSLVNNTSLQKHTKYVFISKLLSISDIANKIPLRTNRTLNLVNISGVIYKNSPNRLQRVLKKGRKNCSYKQNYPMSKTRYKIARISQTNGQKKLDTSSASKKLRVSSKEKLKKCNIPCPYYRKFGKCKRKYIGKCQRKHDPDQIALCTKFLQGACIDPKCLLSHSVSPEKMPTCKFYLEGSCSRDNCPYLHVRISPKADICRDFLEGFCKKASECDKRHQFLCPDFEKKGTCLKLRCAYPHGRMVRKYSDYNKHNFAKKSSKNDNDNNTDVNLINPKAKFEENTEQINPAIRYYSDNKVEIQISQTKSNEQLDVNKQINLRLRPKLGELPSFILLEDT